MPQTETPHRVNTPDALAQVLRLIRESFAYMDGRIDPPSSMHRLTIADLADPGREVWAIGAPAPVACVVLTPKADALYLGKLAVAQDHRGKGLARLLVEHAAGRARALGFPALELQTRIELTDNHTAFAAMGFREIARTAHPGYDRPTSVTLQRALQARAGG